jgi:hypothetical protein
MRPTRREVLINATLLPLFGAPAKEGADWLRSSEGPGVTFHQFGQGTAIYCAFPLSAVYRQEGTPVLRRLVSWMLHLVHPPDARSLLIENAPLPVEVSYNIRGADRFVHLVNSFSAVHGIEVRLQSAARPRRVLLAPERKPVAFEWRDGWARFAAQPRDARRVHNRRLRRRRES